MRQFLLPEGFSGESRLTLSGNDFRYLCRVLRLREGARLSARDVRENAWELEIESIGRSSCVVLLGPGKGSSGVPFDHGAAERNSVPSQGQGSGLSSVVPEVDGPRIVLYQCLPKGRKMDTIVRQATEAGVWAIVPVESEFSVSRITDGESAGTKRDRWTRVVREARQQSGSLIATTIEQPMRLDDAVLHWRRLAEGSSSSAFFFHQEPLAHSSLHRYLMQDSSTIAVAVGSEGGFSDRETQSLVDAGFLPVYLGTNVLRTETAALYAVAAIRIILLEKHSWTISSIEQ
jgi:16S rRNA (uracil1498-N3)-methyltransferase